MPHKDKMHITVYADHDLIQVSHVTASLFELEARGDASVAWRLPVRMPSKPAAPVALRLEAAEPGRTPVRHVFDLHDDRDCWDRFALEWCDRYWKSTYNADSLARLEEPLRAKVRRYGFHFGVRSRGDRHLPLRYIGSGLANGAYQRHKNGGHLAARAYVRSLILRNRRYRSLLYRDEYESRSTDRAVGVYFHPGCYPQGRSDSLDAMNACRRDLIRALKTTLGERFVGGFNTTEVARRQFPEEVYERKLGHRGYVGMLQSAHIVVSTNGLTGCHSWRTAEALAAGAILVTETPTNEVDERLTPGENVFFYDTPDECAAICRDLLSQGEAALRELHGRSQDYYRDCVAPGGRLLERLRGVDKPCRAPVDSAERRTAGCF